MGSIDRYELQTGHRGTPFFLLILTAGKSSGWGGAGEVRVGGVWGGGRRLGLPSISSPDSGMAKTSTCLITFA